MTQAGGSAEQEYERRRAQDRARRRQRLPWVIALVLGFGLGVYLLLLYGLPVLAQQLAGAVVDDPDPVLTRDQVRPIALLGALAATLSAARAAWGRRASTESWRKGAEGERLTARRLEGLVPHGFRVLHDRSIPGTRSNVDHIVVGPTGIFAVETKHYSGTVTAGRRRLRHNGRPMDNVIEQAWREADVVHTALAERLRGTDIAAMPVLCFQGAEVKGRWFRPTKVKGVLVCSGRQLAKRLRKGPATLDAATVDELTRILDEKLPPAGGQSTPAAAEGGASGGQASSAAPPACACGGTYVLRHRRSDGAPFWGCSAFPTCRKTLPFEGQPS